MSLDPKDRYYKAAHAVQAGTKTLIGIDFPPMPSDYFKTYADVRTGLNVSMSEAGGLAELLIKKGLFTEAEYLEAVTLGLEREKARMEKEIESKLGKPVKLY